VDGLIGEDTINATYSYKGDLVKDFHNQRRVHIENWIEKVPTQSTFKDGWENRINNLEKFIEKEIQNKNQSTNNISTQTEKQEYTPETYEDFMDRIRKELKDDDALAESSFENLMTKIREDLKDVDDDGSAFERLMAKARQLDAEEKEKENSILGKTVETKAPIDIKEEAEEKEQQNSTQKENSTKKDTEVQIEAKEHLDKQEPNSTQEEAKEQEQEQEKEKSNQVEVVEETTTETYNIRRNR
jgi:hypothetical protein